MRHPLLFLFFSLAAIATSYNSCTQETEPKTETEAEEPVMRKVSDLVNLMFKMEGDLKLLRTKLTEDMLLAPIEHFIYEDIFTAEASSYVRRDSVYVINGTDYLKELHQLSQSETKENALISFNAVVDACVTCHESYCPGPVARIKKLRI